MSKIEENLKKETIKWLARLKKERKTIHWNKEKVSLENVDAYMADCQHFLETGNLIEAFEAVIYAYGLLDMLKFLGHIQATSHQQPSRLR